MVRGLARAKAVGVAGLEIQLFGEFRVRRGGLLVERREWGGQKTRSLLKLLLAHPGRTFSRDEILDALWPGIPPEAAEKSLRVTISLLRKVLEPNLKRGSDSCYVLSRRPGYTFDRHSDCRVDAWEYEERRKRAETAQKVGQLEEAIAGYRAALDLVRGEFLAEEPYEDWAVEARVGWRERHLGALSNLSECLALKGRYTEAVEVCERALEADGYREELHRRLMLYHYCSGEQGLALKAYRRYAKLLKEELGVAPSPELARLKAGIEARDVPGVDEGRRRYPRPRRPLRFPYSLGRTHFVGREREYALLAERLREAAEGSGGVVAVEGEAGVGKTRLVEEFLGYAKSRGALMLAGRCYERELGPPLEPITEALGPSPATAETAPGMLLPAEKELGYPREAEPYDGTRAYRALTRELVRRSRGHEALVLFVDDVQWADPATLGFLSFSAKRIPGERILLVVSYRREDAPALSGWLDHLAERRVVAALSLDRLSSRDTTELLERMASRGFDGLPTLADFLYRESEGNPFYAVEYLRWLIESGAVEVDARRRLSSLKSERLREGILPSGVRSLVRARLGRMDDEARDLVELAAVIGRTFDLGLLCKAAARGEDRAFGTIEPLVNSGLVVGVLGNTYHFFHDKLRQALYEGIGDPRRRTLHLRVAETLEKEDGGAAELAHHYLRAEAWRPALESLMSAARAAEEGYAWDAALKSYVRALEIVGELPDPDERRFEILASQERLFEHMDRREERAEAVRGMSGLASRLGDGARIAEVHVRRIGVLAALSDPAGAEEAGRAAVSAFRELEDGAGEARAHREMGYVYWMNGDAVASLEANFRALRLNREFGDRRSEAGDVGNIAEVYRGMGNYDEALRWAQEAVGIYRELGDKLGEAMRLATVAQIHRERGDLETALRLVLETLRLYAMLGTKNLLVAQHSACGTLYLTIGNPHEALKHFRSAFRFSREIGYARDEGYSLMSVGVSLEQIEDHAGAAKAYRRASELLGTAYEVSRITDELSGKADALTLLASVLHRSLDRPAEALETYGAAAGIYRELGETRRLRKPLARLAGLRWRMGDPEGSARDFEEALELAREHGEAAHEAAALASLSVVYRDLGRLKESVRCGRSALRLLRSLDDLQAEGYVLSSLAESYRGLGHYSSALSCLRRSLRLRKKTGDEEGEIGVLQDLAGIYEELGDKGHARTCSEEAASKKGALEEITSGAERSN
jgi:DNA-binding SARP family transcriptional activator